MKLQLLEECLWVLKWPPVLKKTVSFSVYQTNVGGVASVMLEAEVG